MGAVGKKTKGDTHGSQDLPKITGHADKEEI